MTTSLYTITICLYIIIFYAYTITSDNNDNSKDSPTYISKLTGLSEDDWISLPEVFSKLDFEADTKFAHESDIKGQIELRNTRYWGRLYIDGFPQTIQYFRAHFGIVPPIGNKLLLFIMNHLLFHLIIGKKIFVFSDPIDGCGDINADGLTENHILLIKRGNCTFGTKAKNAFNTGMLLQCVFY